MFDSINYNSFSKAVVRVPLLSLEETLTRSFTNQKLFEMLERPIVKEAIYLASPHLFKRYIDYKNGSIKSQKAIKKLIISLTKYLYRMSIRPTPFGTFASSGLYGLSDSSTINDHSISNIKRFFSLSNELIIHIKETLLQIPEMFNCVTYFHNSSSFMVNGKIRFYSRYYQNSSDGHNAQFEYIKINSDPIIKHIYSMLEEGLTFQSILDSCKIFTLSNEYINELLLKLIEVNFLISELDQISNDYNYFNRLLEFITKKNNEGALKGIAINNQSLINELFKIQSDIVQFNLIGANNYLEFYNKFDILIEKLFPKFKGVKFRIDTTACIKDSFLSKNLEVQCLETAKILTYFSTIKNPNLERFKKEFLERFDNNEIPLLELLDPELGIDYPSIKDKNQHLNLRLELDDSNAESLSWDIKESFLLKKYLFAIENNLFEIELSDRDLNHFKEDPKTLPNTFSINCKIFEDHSISSKSRTLFYIKNFSFANALEPISRFSFINNDFASFCHEIHSKEVELSSNQIIADIIHAPSGKAGNVLWHENFNDYQIPYLSLSHKKTSYQINVDDILVSLRNNTIVLKSKKLNQYIIPRLNSNHNFYFNSLPIYHFLCDLQTQDTALYPHFTWGALNKKFRFLPRVVYKNALLHLATWNLNSNDFREIKSLYDQFGIVGITKYRERNRIPDLVVLAYGDRELVIDFGNTLSIEIFLEETINKPSFSIFEYLNPIDLIKDDYKKKYSFELIFSFYKTYNNQNSNKISQEISENKVQVKYSPFDSWQYWKLYIAISNMNSIINSVLGIIINKSIQKGIISKWFFVRYSDPHPHLRLRFFVSNDNQIYELDKILNSTCKEYFNTGEIWKITKDSYQRELTRYGEDLISEAETLFYNDSMALLSILNDIGNSNDDGAFIFAGIESIFSYFEEFQFTFVQQMDFVSKEVSKRRYFKNSKNIDEVNSFYRNHKLLLYDMFISKKVNSNFGYLFRQRRYNNEKAIKVLRNSLSFLLIEEQLHNYIHMSMNRLFSKNPNYHEDFIYYVLERLYLRAINQLNLETES